MQQKFEVFITFFGLIFKMKCDFVNIEESVREPYVPNLPGVQPRRRFFNSLLSMTNKSDFSGLLICLIDMFYNLEYLDL